MSKRPIESEGPHSNDKESPKKSKEGNLGTVATIKVEQQINPKIQLRTKANVVSTTIQSSHRFGALTEIVESEDMKDVKLMLNGKEPVMVHRLVLAAMSKPLCRRLKDTPGDVVELAEVQDVVAFNAMLDYMYGRPLTIDPDNVMKILTVACIWHVDDLKTHCIKFLTTNVSSLNTAEVLNIAERLKLPDVAEVAAEYVAKNCASFDEVFFQALPDSSFTKIFSRVDLHLPKAGERSIIDLIFLRAGSEEARADELLKNCVRFVDLTDDQIGCLYSDKRFDTLARKNMLMDSIMMTKYASFLKTQKGLFDRLHGLAYTKSRRSQAKGSMWSLFY